MPRQAKIAKKSTKEDGAKSKKVSDQEARIAAAFHFFDDIGDDEGDSINDGSVSTPPAAPSVVVKVPDTKVQPPNIESASKQQTAKQQAVAGLLRRKRELSDELDDADGDNGRQNNGGGDFGIEMKKMLEGFGADYNKTVSGKRKRLDQFIALTVRNSNKKVDDIWRGQQTSRQKLTEEYCKQVNSVFSQWETDLEKVREQEDKLQTLLKQQQKLSQQTRVVQSQRLKTIKQLHEAYNKNLLELDSLHEDQQTTIPSELKKEMALLQKRILMDTQQQEMANVRKSLQNMLY